MNQWLKHPVIVELESLGEGPANFVTLLLCTLIRETLKASPRADEEKVVRHIIFIEEAHNLIAPEAQVASGQDSNPKIAATAYIVKMLAEVRALREGIIIADQLPTAMAPEVIKNTNIKLIHRLTSIDDRQLIGSTMSASGIQLEHVAVYRPGEALMSYEGLQRPFELRIQEQKGHGSETPNDDELYDIMLHKPAFFQLAQKEENLKCCISIRFVMQTIHNLQRFADIVPSIRGLDRHYDAFFPVDNADCSFLTDFDSIAEGLEAAKNDSDNYLAMVGSNSPLSRLAALKDILKSEDYVAAVSNLLFADQEVAPYAGMKKMILCLSMEETDEATALLLDTYCTVIMNYLRLSTAKEKVGKDNPFISASTEQILPIDLLIAQSIKSSKSGSPQEVDTNLDEFLEYYPLICTSSWEDQLFILQKVFAYLKMYSQERKVLEFLVKNNIPRTEQIDRRLNFLKNLNQNDISNAANSIEEFSIQTSDNEIAYDYRFISWTVSEINSYMNLLTSEDKTLDLPMVVAEWNKKIPQKNIRWSTDAMQVYLDKYLHENFGDLYTTKIKNCGAVLSNEVEYEPSIYIEATDSAKYPWLSFVVTGEQLTMTQVSFAIYALYLPTKDSQCTQAVDTIEQNQKYQNRLITLKQAQNPKIKNYIESINEILISGLEAWLNNNNTSSMYD